MNYKSKPREFPLVSESPSAIPLIRETKSIPSRAALTSETTSISISFQRIALYKSITVDYKLWSTLSVWQRGESRTSDHSLAVASLKWLDQRVGDPYYVTRTSNDLWRSRLFGEISRH
ncbi:hypothetical protein CEXT_187431 [Caerostris extrusa]|uniref:Uncharacterized protein n=1 Tax=Caerostris extrusa TaxID=172846 RepID=A0AAV4WVG8_CAEEX|nr:hypothetical protein CEXT_187431 [Caerostris extrusa]